MPDYYDSRLSAERLRRCYDIASPRVKQYLRAEIDYSLKFIFSNHRILELGCGYGRILAPIAESGAELFGVDTSLASLKYARDYLSDRARIYLVCADAAHLPFPASSFDRVLCLQNGISAFHVDHRELFAESLRVLRDGGCALFSSYSPQFWPHRLEWFRMQARAGLIGPIDERRTGDGRIICTDGFAATTTTDAEFRELARESNVSAETTEVDDSSLFCVVTRDRAIRPFEKAS